VRSAPRRSHGVSTDRFGNAYCIGNPTTHSSTEPLHPTKARLQGIYQNVGGNLNQSTRGLIPSVDLVAIGMHERLSHVCQNLPSAQWY
jgi:hypothetical protein